MGVSPLSAISVSISQTFRVAAVKGSGTRGLIPVDCDECRPHIQIHMEHKEALWVLGSFLAI